jgi:myo-inositol-1(or 4)-monophosphatase
MLPLQPPSSAIDSYNNSINMHIKHLEAQVVAILKEAKSRFFDAHSGDYSSLDIKGLNQLVTNTDVATEKFLVQELGKLIPDCGFIAEEGHHKEIPTSGFQWIIDPLDGTTNYVHKIPVYSISVALQLDGKVIAGFVYELNRDELFYANQQGEAFCNHRPIAVNQNRSLEDTLVATGFPYYDFDHMEAYLDVLRFSMQNTRGIRRLGSAAVDLAYVACGRFDAFFEYGLAPWDVAAGAYIVTCAGGKVSDFAGGDNFIFGKQILATIPDVYSVYLSQVEKMK